MYARAAKEQVRKQMAKTKKSKGKAEYILKTTKLSKYKR